MKYYSFNAPKPRYSFEVKEFIRLNYKQKTYPELVRELNTKFNTNYTVCMIIGLAWRLGLKKRGLCDDVDG